MRDIVSKVSDFAIPIAFVVLGLFFGSQEYHWDTLERAVILENPGGFLRSWDGSPRSQFLSFAHILELPLATLVRLVVGSPSGMHSLVLFELLCAACALWVIARIVRQRHGGRMSALAAQFMLACCWGFWKMGTSGEERLLAMATLLLFLWAFWTILHTGRGAILVSGSLILAILSHLSNAVLLPFAFLGLAILPEPQRQHRRRAAIAVVLGALITGVVYVAVAAFTSNVRTLPQLWNYLTFFHRDTGNDFFTVTLSPETWRQSLHGLRAFLSEPTWVANVALVVLVAIPMWRAGRRTQKLPMQERHMLVLGLLWTLHFAFYEPINVESWTLVGMALVLSAAWGLRSHRQAMLLVALALLLLITNVPSFQRLHQPMPLLRALEQVVDASDPNDIILMGGGIQNQRPLRGSHATRFFLAHERQRTIISLYDVMQITQREFWGRPIASLQELQQAIDSGRRVWFPAFLFQEFEAAQQSGHVDLQVVAHGDSLYEVTAVGAPTP